MNEDCSRSFRAVLILRLLCACAARQCRVFSDWLGSLCQALAFSEDPGYLHTVLGESSHLKLWQCLLISCLPWGV